MSKMNVFKHITAVVALSLGLSALGQDSAGPDVPQLMPAAETEAAAETITANYSGWDKVTLSGKLHLDRLPISPSVKIYMERGRRIVISLRAPFLGEVGTVDIDSTRFTLVNKMNRTYCIQPLAELMADLPVTLSDLQDIFLARIFLPGSGTLGMDNYTQADFYLCANPAGWLLVPREQPIEYDVSCGFTALPDGRTNDILVTTLDGNSCATATYSYDGKHTDITITVRHGGKDRDFRFSVNDIDPDGKSVKPAVPGEKYRQLTVRDFFKQMK